MRNYRRPELLRGGSSEPGCPIQARSWLEWGFDLPLSFRMALAVRNLFSPNLIPHSRFAVSAPAPPCSSARNSLPPPRAPAHSSETGLARIAATQLPRPLSPPPLPGSRPPPILSPRAADTDRKS